MTSNILIRPASLFILVILADFSSWSWQTEADVWQTKVTLTIDSEHNFVGEIICRRREKEFGDTFNLINSY